jgi:hypothetical protein
MSALSGLEDWSKKFAIATAMNTFRNGIYITREYIWTMITVNRMDSLERQTQS